MTEHITEQTAVTVITSAEEYNKIIKLVTDGLSSRHSVRAYEKAIADFLKWRDDEGRPPINKALVNGYKRAMDDAGLAPSTINQRLSAVRRLALEASDNGLISEEQAVSITKVRGIKTAGTRAGNWIDAKQAQAVLDAPFADGNADNAKHVRDTAILATLLGAGLRRTEAASLEVRHLAERDGRPCLVDITGKGRKTRTVPIAPWIAEAITDWLEEANITEGRIFRRLSKSGRVTGESMTPQAIYAVWKEYGPAGTAPHDARRTFAKSAHLAGAPLEQISLLLGHTSIDTTRRYLGLELDYTAGQTASDRLPFGL